MDRGVIDQKLESMRKCVDRVKQKVPLQSAELQTDLDAQDIISVNLERAVQMAVDIASHLLSQLEAPVPATIADSFDALLQANVISIDVCTKIKKAVGFRNLLVHEYSKINWSTVYSIATKEITVFKEYASAIDKWLKQSVTQT